MTDLKEQLDRALTAFEPSGQALPRTMERVRRRQSRRRVQGRSVGALVVILAFLAVLIPVFHDSGGTSRRATTGAPVSGTAIVAATHDGSVQLLSTTGVVLRTLISAGTGTAKWGEPVSISVSETEETVYIGYEILSPTRYSARIERVSLEGGRPVFVAHGTQPAVSPDGTELAYIQESTGRCQPEAPCPPLDVNLPVIVRNLTTGSEHRLPASHAPGVSRLSWSDDDVHLALSDGNGFWVEDTSTSAAATSEVSIFPPANSIPPYWSDAVYRGSSGSLGVVAFCPETVGCDQGTEILNIDPTTQKATLVAHLDFGTRSLTFDSSGLTFAYVGLAPGTALPSPLSLKKCATAVLCIGSASSRRAIPVDTLLFWHDGTTKELGTGYVSVAMSGTGATVPSG